MPFEGGTFSMTMFKLAGPLPENHLELFSAKRAGKLDEVKDEVQVGWVSGRHLLESRIDDVTSYLGGYPYINLRFAQRKIPSTLLKAECKLEELVYMQANNVADVPRKIKREIKEMIVEKRMPMMVPQLGGIPVVIDPADESMYLGATSAKQIDEFLAFYSDTLKTPPPVQVTAEEMALRLKFDPRDYKGMPLVNEEDELSIGRDFLTWMWYHSETEGGEVEVQDYGEFAAMVDGPLVFAAEGNGSFETAVRNGNPLRSAEAGAALNVGKKLKKAKLVFARGNEVWTASFDADRAAFTGMALPEGEEMDLGGRFAERVNFLHIFQSAVRGYFQAFLAQVTGPKRAESLKKMREWVEKRECL